MNKIRRLDQAINLARRIASDILIYHKDVVLAGLSNGDLYERLSKEIDEGRRLYLDRVDLADGQSSEHFERALNDVLVLKGVARLARD